MNFNPFRLDVDYKNRVYGLDIIRAYAIIQVVIIHSSLILQNVSTDFPWISLIEGVEVFFVLSGFLIGSILISTCEKQGVSFGVIIKFLKRRWFRTLPNYYLILLVNIVFVYFGIAKGDFSQFNYKFFLFLQNFSKPMFGFFDESWSLSIEEWFYILFPAGILTAMFFLRKLKVKHVIFLIICLFIIIPFILRLFVLNNDWFWIGARVKGMVIYKLDAIAFGILGAWVKAYHKEYWYRFKNFLFGAGLILIYAYMYTYKQNHLLFYRVFNSSIMGVLILLMFPKLDSIKEGRGRFSKIVTHISLISYSMYLLNLAVICEVITTHFMPVGFLPSIGMFILYWFLVIILSSFLYKFYEKPIMNLRGKAG